MRLVITTSLLLLLTACGGGNSDQTQNQEVPWLGGTVPNDTPVVVKNKLPKISISNMGDPIFGTEYALTITLSDEDPNDKLTLLKENMPDWLVWDEDQSAFVGTPNRLATYQDIKIGVTDGKDTVYLDPLSLTIKPPESLYLPVLSPNNTDSEGLTLLIINENGEEIEALAADDRGLPFPYQKSTYNNANIFVRWQVEGSMPWYAWLGNYQTLLTELPDTLTVSPEVLKQWTPTPQATAYIHALNKQVAGNEFTVLNKNDINLYHDFISADNVKFLSELYYLSVFGDIKRDEKFNLTDLLNMDRNELSTTSILTETFYKKAQSLFEDNLVNDRYFSDLLKEADEGIKEKYPLNALNLTNGTYYLSPSKQPSNDRNEGEILSNENAKISITQNKYQSEIELTPKGVGNNLFTLTYLSSEPKKENLILGHLDKASLRFSAQQNQEIENHMLQASLMTLPIEITSKSRELEMVYETPFHQMLMIDKKVDSVLFLDGFSLENDVITEQSSTVIPQDSLVSLLWKWNERKFDIILPFPQQDNQLLATWLDLYDMEHIKQRINGVWQETDWKASYQESTQTILFENREKGLQYTVTNQKEAHLVNINEQQQSNWIFGTLNQLSDQNGVLSTSLGNLQFHAKVFDDSYTLVPDQQFGVTLIKPKEGNEPFVGAGNFYLSEQTKQQLKGVNSSWVPGRIGFAVFDYLAESEQGKIAVYDMFYHPVGSSFCGESKTVGCVTFEHYRQIVKPDEVTEFIVTEQHNDAMRITNSLLSINRTGIGYQIYETGVLQYNDYRYLPNDLLSALLNYYTVNTYYRLGEHVTIDKINEVLKNSYEPSIKIKE